MRCGRSKATKHAWGCIGVTNERSVTIPVNMASAAVGLWVTALALMIVGTLLDFDRAAWWALLIGMAAVCETIAALMRHHRRVVLEVVSYEFRARDLRESETVVPFQKSRT